MPSNGHKQNALPRLRYTEKQRGKKREKQVPRPRAKRRPGCSLVAALLQADSSFCPLMTLLNAFDDADDDDGDDDAGIDWSACILCLISALAIFFFKFPGE